MEYHFKLVRNTMITWTIEQWVAVAIVWTWGTLLSGKLRGILEGFFQAKILAIYPHYHFTRCHRGIPAWLVGAACVWVMTRYEKIMLDFLYLDDPFLTRLISVCLLSLILIFFLTYFGWLLPNQFRIAGTVADATAMRWKSMKPYED